MKNIKTTALGLSQIIGAIFFVLFKMQQKLAITDAEAGLVLLAVTSGIKGLVAADAKPEVAAAPAAPVAPPPDAPK